MSLRAIQPSRGTEALNLNVTAADRDSVADFLDSAGLRPDSGSMTDSLWATHQAFHRRALYENLSKINRLAAYRDPVPERLETPSVLLRNLLEKGTGGTCYSLAYNLAALMEAMGIPSYLTLNDLGGRRANHAAVVAVIDNTTWLCDPGLQLRDPIPFSPTATRVSDNGWGQVSVTPTEPAGRYWVRQTNGAEEWDAFQFYSEPVSEEEFRAVWQGSYNGPMMRTFHLFRHCGGHTRHLIWGTYSEMRPNEVREKLPLTEAEALGKITHIWPEVPAGHVESAQDAVRGWGGSPIWGPPV